MGYRSIRTFNFRNLEDVEIDIDAPCIFIVGENGQGKTNLIESIYYLCYGSSFRTKKDLLICKNSAAQFAIDGVIFSSDGDLSRIECRWSREKKEIRLNEKQITDRRELIQIMPCIVFGHQDFQYVFGSPSFQRTFFDQTNCLVNPSYVETIRRYRQILKLRNMALRDHRISLIDTYDEQITDAGIAIIERRIELVDRFNALFSELFAKVDDSHDLLSIDYRQSWDYTDNRQRVIDTLMSSRERDIMAGMTMSGPHRDRFVFYCKDRDFVQYASTGQIRLASVVMKLAQAQYYYNLVGKCPVLLIDDVLLEIDPRRRRRFLENLPDWEQMFFTFLPDERYEGYKRSDTIVYTMKNGRVVKQ